MIRQPDFEAIAKVRPKYAGTQNRPAAVSSMLQCRSRVIGNNFNVVFAVVVIGVLSNAIVPELVNHGRADTGGFAAIADVGISKVLIACIIVSVYKLLRAEATDWRPVDALLMLAPLAGTLASSGTTAWAGLALCTGGLLLRGGWSHDIKTALRIILVASLHAPAGSLLGQLSGGHLLWIDRWAASALLSLFSDAKFLSGNAIQITGGNMIVLIWECGVFKNVSLVLLIWITALSFGAAQGHRPKIANALALVFFCLLANAVRLSLMASHEKWFDDLHDGLGATAYRLVLLSAAIGFASWRRSHDAA